MHWRRGTLISNYRKITGSALLVIITAFFLISCGKKEVKTVSPESKLAIEAFELAEILRKAYVRNDRETLQERSTSEGYRDMLGVMKSFDRAELTFTPTWVETDDKTVSLTVSWKGTWTVREKLTEERGIGVFVMEGRPLKLVQVLRANPFRQPE
jgi:hypothetical protein